MFASVFFLQKCMDVEYMYKEIDISVLKSINKDNVFTTIVVLHVLTEPWNALGKQYKTPYSLKWDIS